MENSFNHQAAAPFKVCPVCGSDSVQPVTQTEDLKMFRCRAGHFFSADAATESGGKTSG
jgi:hypothetical protein